MKRRAGAGWGAFLCGSWALLAGDGCDRPDEHELWPPFVLNRTRFALPVEVPETRPRSSGLCTLRPSR